MKKTDADEMGKRVRKTEIESMLTKTEKDRERGNKEDKKIWKMK